MSSNDRNAAIRLSTLLLLAVVVWLLGRVNGGMPQPLGLDAPATAFSAARAEAVLARVLGPELPHPAGTIENANVRARIQKEFGTVSV